MFSISAAHTLNNNESSNIELIFTVRVLVRFAVCSSTFQTNTSRFLVLPRVLPEAVVNDISGENKAGAADVSASQHVMVCALKELGSLVQSLSATASPLIQEPSIGGAESIKQHITRRE